MKRWWINGICMMLAGALTVFAVGCGDDDDKGTNGTTGDLTEEEQYVLAQQLMAAAPGLMIQNFGSQFWDGVDPEDFTFNLFGLGKAIPPGIGKRIPMLSTPTQLEADTVIYGYTPSGWWKFHVEFALEDDTLGIAVSIVLDDSVRFQTETGTAQPDPDENTHTFLHEGELTLNVSLDAESLGTFVVGIGGDNDFTVTGLNQAMVTVNGSTGAAIDFEIDTDSADAEIEMEFLGTVDDVIAPNEPEACPVDGMISLDFEMDFYVEAGDEVSRGSGDWEVDVDILNADVAHVTVRSGDFEVEGDQSICEPPL